MDGLIDSLFDHGADPWVIRHENAYFYIQSRHNGLTLQKSPTLAGLTSADRVNIWHAPATGPNSREIWAPEIHVIDGKWTVYYAADAGNNDDHRMFVLQCAGDDPMRDRFVDKGKLNLPDDRWAIDGTSFEVRGQRYFCWSGWEGDKNVDQRLYVAKMKDAATIVGPRVEISRPTLPWECRGGKPSINEGPEALSHGGRTHIIYSASGSWSDYYCLGRLTLKDGADPMVARNWTKADQPAFEGAHGIISPGHCSFVDCAEDGGKPWIIYHCARHLGAGWDRYVRAQRFEWNGDIPHFGKPAAPIGREH